MLKKVISFIILFFLFCININADELDLSSDKYILYNMNDNNILMKKNQDDRTSIASLTKIMTVIIAIENIDDYSEKVTITKEMIDNIEWDVAVTGFKVGDKVTYDDLLYGAIVASGADAVNALAISISGNYDKYVELMNNKVNELNLKNTHFTNVAGLYDSNHYSSAYDMSQILIYALKNNKFKEVFETKYYTSSNDIKMKSTIVKYNSNYSDISYITGTKTGYISKAGYCLASTATLENVNYLLITLNSFGSSTSHIEDAIKTYKYYSDNYGYINIVNNDDIIVKLDTKYAKEKTIDIYSNEVIDAYLKKDTIKSKDISYDYNGINTISYFTKTGTKLGNVKIMYYGNEINNFDLIYNGTLTFSLWLLLWNYKYYILGLILFIIVLILVKKKPKKRK